MAVTISQREFAPFGNCVVISNDEAELMVTVDVGPRIISYKRTGGENLFFADTEKINISDDPSIEKTFGAKVYWFKGGHRMWGTPEDMPLTYVPDDVPVDWKEENGAVVFTQRPQPIADWQYEMTVRLADKGTDVTVGMKITNLRDEIRETGAWGISQMKKNGTCICVLNKDLSVCPLSDKILVLWPYNKLNDERFYMGENFVALSQSPDAPVAFKFGTNCTVGQAAYVANTEGKDVFIKKFGYTPGVKYPDNGCNFESYSSDVMLEVETLGEMKKIGKGEFVEHTEQWSICTLDDEEAKDIAAMYAEAVK